MDGLLKTVITLGVCKTACNLLSLPAVRASLNSVSFCCSCLLLFTDLAVTVFLAFLWLAVSWLPPFAVPKDVVTLRVLLFLGHTYGAVLLLTTPLIAVETAYRLQYSLTDGTAGSKMPSAQDKDGGDVSDMERQRACAKARDWTVYMSVNQNPTAGRRGQDQESFDRKSEDRDREPVTPAHGFLCCLMVWILCGVCSGQDMGPAEQSMEACLQHTNSLSVCLPNLLTMILAAVRDHSLTLAALALVLALAMTASLFWQGYVCKASDPLVGKEKELPRPAHCTPTYPEAVTPEPSAPNPWKASSEPVLLGECSKYKQKPNDSHLSLETDCGQTEFIFRDKALSTKAHCELSQHTCSVLILTHSVEVELKTHRLLSTWDLEGEKHPSHQQQLVQRGWDTSCSGRRVHVLTGLVCGVTLYLYPPAMSVNMLLIMSVERLTEWGLRHLLSTSK